MGVDEGKVKTFDQLGTCSSAFTLIRNKKVHLSLVHMHNTHPGVNIHPGCKFAPGVYFGHVNGVL